MLQLAISTLGCPEWDFARIEQECNRLAIQGIEVRGINGIMEPEKIDWPAALTTGAPKDGLKVIGFGTSVSFHDAAAYEKNIADGKLAIDVCKQQNIPFIRVFGDRIENPMDEQAVIDRIITGLKTLCDYSASIFAEVSVLLEIHGNINTIERLTQIISALGSDRRFGIIWDVQHSHRAYGEDFIPFYNLIKPYVRHMHIKDFKFETGKCVMMGHGDIPIGAIVDALLADGYDGYFSFEWEKKWHPDIEEPDVAFPQFVEYMRSLTL